LLLATRVPKPLVHLGWPAGNIGSDAALNSSPGGYTLLLCSVANAISATL
jgi:hypothetical protein